MYKTLKSWLGRHDRGTQCGHKPARTRLGMEALELREVPSATATMLAGGVLQVTGSEQAEEIRVVNYGTTTVVTDNGTAIFGTPSLGVNKIKVDTRGNDDVVVAQRLPVVLPPGSDPYLTYMYNQRPIPVEVDGGFGNDTLAKATGDVGTLRGSYGNDKLYGGSVGDTLDGGYDNDLLEGNAGNDTLYGGFGNDTLKGGKGGDTLDGGFNNDVLYGGDGDDALKGSFGNDGLFGGRGTDTLDGGGDADRLLVWAGEFTDSAYHSVLYPETKDAVVMFSLGTEEWTADEIERVDKALGILHEAVGNTTLLKVKTANGPVDGLVFKKNDGQGVGFNSGGTVTLTDFVLNGNSTWETGYALHEIGHNWDQESPIYTDFLAVSGWTQTDPRSTAFTRIDKYGETWWYRTSAERASGYAMTHPLDDFAESFAAYFLQRAGLPWYSGDGRGAAAIPIKIALIDGWVRSL